MNNDVILEVKNLCKDYINKKLVVHAVSDVSFTLRRGQTLGIVGESGCGKTTLGRCIVRGIPATSGEVLFHSPEGKTVDYLSLKGEALKDFRRHIQMIFQDPYSSLDPRMTVYDIICEPLKANFHLPKEELDKKVLRIAELTGLNLSFLRRYPHAFSGGQRQRIGIARALVMYPQLVICDEAVSALDVSIQAQIINLLKDLQQELGLTYIFISHALSVVEHISDMVMVMYLGRVVEMGTVERLFTRPAHPYTEALLSAAPKPDPDIKTERIILEGEVPSPANPPSGCYFHPRCPYALERCAQQSPALTDVGDGHMCACLRAKELHLRQSARV